jgi:hypothetical protein
MSPSYFVISAVGATMSAVNLMGYIKCEKDYKKKAAQYVAQQGFLQSMLASSITSRLFG